MASYFLELLNEVMEIPEPEGREQAARILIGKFLEIAPHADTASLLECYYDALVLALDPVISTPEGRTSTAFCNALREQLKKKLMRFDRTDSINLALEALCNPAPTHAALAPLRLVLNVIRDGVNDDSAGRLPFVEDSKQSDEAARISAIALGTGGVRLKLGNSAHDCRDRGGELLAHVVQVPGGATWNKLPRELTADQSSTNMKKAVQRALQDAPDLIKTAFTVTNYGVEISKEIQFLPLPKQPPSA